MCAWEGGVRACQEMKAALQVRLAMLTISLTEMGSYMGGFRQRMS